MIAGLIMGTFFLLLGVLGLIYRKKIARADVRGHANFYGWISGKKVKKTLNKDKMFYEFFKDIFILLSLACLFLAFVIFMSLFK